MQPLDLKLVREVLVEAGRELSECSKAVQLNERIAGCVHRLDVYAALSDYDRAILAIAPYLPGGYVAQDDGAVGWTCHYQYKPGMDEWSWKSVDSDSENAISEPFKIPVCDDWRASLRRVTHNQDGTTTVGEGV